MYRHIREKHNFAAEHKTDVETKEKLAFYSCKFCNEIINKNDFVEHIKKNHHDSIEKIKNNITTKKKQTTELVKMDNSNNQNLVEKDSEIETPTQKKSKDNINEIDPFNNLGDPQKVPIEQSNEIEISNDVVDSSEIGLDMTVEEVNHNMHGIVENKINNKQIVDTTIDQQIEQSINVAVEEDNQKHETFENRIDDQIIETMEVGNYQQIEPGEVDVLKHIQDQLSKAQAIKCDMCSYLCSDLYSMEQHFSNVHIEKSQSINSEIEQNTDIAIKNVIEDRGIMISDDHNSDEVTELDPLDISSPTAMESNDLMQGQATPAHVQESNVQEDHTQQGFQQSRIKIMVMPKNKFTFLECNFCHKMLKKGEFAEHVKANHKTNDGFNEIVEQRKG